MIELQTERDLVEWGYSSFTLEGQTASGDRPLVEPFPGGVLVAAVDGIGHGPEAAVAAETAVAVLRANASLPLVSLFPICHEALKSTRGAVLTIASLNARTNTMSWLGVGNVEGVLVRQRRHGEQRGSHNALLLSGLVGYRLPNLRPPELPLFPGDLLFLATDGVRSDFSHESALNESPQRIAERICRRHKKGTDDALALVVRYLGQRP